MLLYNLHGLLFEFRKGQPNTFWEMFKQNYNTSIYLCVVVSTTSTVGHLFLPNLKYLIYFIWKPLLGLWMIHWSRLSVKSVFLLSVLYLKLWPKPFWWKIQLMNICTKCFPAAKIIGEWIIPSLCNGSKINILMTIKIYVQLLLL